MEAVLSRGARVTVKIIETAMANQHPEEMMHDHNHHSSDMIRSPLEAMLENQNINDEDYELDDYDDYLPGTNGNPDDPYGLNDDYDGGEEYNEDEEDYDDYLDDNEDLFMQANPNFRLKSGVGNNRNLIKSPFAFADKLKGTSKSPEMSEIDKKIQKDIGADILRRMEAMSASNQKKKVNVPIKIEPLTAEDRKKEEKKKEKKEENEEDEWQTDSEEEEEDK